MHPEVRQDHPGKCPKCAMALEPGHEVELKDPVCQMTVTNQSPHSLEHKGQHYYFCSGSCKNKFAVDPDKYLAISVAHGNESSNADAEAPEGTMFTCPMHPEIRQDHPGNCPKCGMALEPEMPTLEDEDNPELADFRRRGIP